MRISDWSSDVCSSDLAIAIEFKSKADIEKHKGKLRGKIVFLDPEREYKPGTEADFQRHDEATLEGLQEFVVPADRDDAREKRIKQIGRASCRERGGQYVSMSVVAVYIQKKKAQ